MCEYAAETTIKATRVRTNEDEIPAQDIQKKQDKHRLKSRQGGAGNAASEPTTCGPAITANANKTTENQNLEIAAGSGKHCPQELRRARGCRHYSSRAECSQS